MRQILLGLYLLPFLLAGWLSPHDPSRQFRDHAGMAPGCSEPCFLLGTDDLGRDVLSRTLHGGRLTLFSAAGASIVAVLAGGLLGGAAGYFGGWIDALLTKPVDLLATLPWLYLLLAIRGVLPLSLPGEWAVPLVMGVLGIAGTGVPFRQARLQVLAAGRSDPVAAAEGLGARPWYLLRAHLIPAAAPALRATWASLFPAFVIAEVSLSFFGLGAGEPAVSWGSVLAELRRYPVLVSEWWLFAPAAALAGLLALLPPRWTGVESR